MNDEFTARGKNPGVSWDLSPRPKYCKLDKATRPLGGGVEDKYVNSIAKLLFELAFFAPPSVLMFGSERKAWMVKKLV